MPAVRFEPDPLLSRTVPRGKGSFDVLPLLVPARPVFRADRSLRGDETDPSHATMPALEGPAQAERPDGLAVPGLEGPQADRADAQAVGSESLETQPLEAVEASVPDAHAQVPDVFSRQQVQEMLALRYREGFEEGLAQGAQGFLSAEPSGPAATDTPDETSALLQSVGRALLDLNGPHTAAERFEPLKRLALHLATELARAELSLSNQAVDRLVRRCVESLDARGLQVVVELHPLDLQQWRALVDAGGVVEAALQAVQFKEDASLSRGSVRARSDHACVEDLIEHRLAGLVQDLRIDAQRWQSDQTALSAAVDAGMTGQPEQETPGDA